MNHPETHPVTAKHGPRPAGQPDECFYCSAAVGDHHDPNCVMRARTVVLRYSFNVVVAVPEHWTPEQVEFHRNDSSWCADNAIHAEFTQRREDACWCPDFRAKYVREATEDDESRWALEMFE